MRYVLLSLGTMCGLAPALRADAGPDAKAIIEKAIKARGDQPDAKNVALAWKDKGTFHGLGAPLPYTADWTFLAPDKYRFGFLAAVGDVEIKMIVVVNGEKAWAAEGTKVEEMTGEKLEQTRNEAYQLWVTMLTPLVTDKGFTLATVPGKDVERKPTV